MQFIDKLFNTQCGEKKYIKTDIFQAGGIK